VYFRQRKLRLPLGGGEGRAGDPVLKINIGGQIAREIEFPTELMELFGASPSCMAEPALDFRSPVPG